MTKPDYEWIAAGEEWSEPWGGSAAQWYGSILPRIQTALPAKTIVEIASGFGRWSFYLKEYCAELHLVEPDRQCLEACQRRFGSDPKIKYQLNDGTSLAMIPNSVADFIFSFDSLVHVRRVTLEAYVKQFAEKLTPEGLAFIHHSNLGELTRGLSHRVRLAAKSKPGSDHQRDPEMTAQLFRQISEEQGLKVICQEVINWRGRRLIDCFSTLARQDSKWQASAELYRNRDFMREAELIRRRAGYYPRQTIPL